MPLSDKMLSGFPCRKIILFVTACVTASAVARRNGVSFVHLENRSCITSSHVCPFLDLGIGPIRSMQTCCQGRFTSVACSFPAGLS